MNNPQVYVEAALKALPLFLCQPHYSVRVEEVIPLERTVRITISYVPYHPDRTPRSWQDREYRIIMVDARTAEATSIRLYSHYKRGEKVGCSGGS